MLQHIFLRSSNGGDMSNYYGTVIPLSNGQAYAKILTSDKVAVATRNEIKGEFLILDKQGKIFSNYHQNNDAEGVQSITDGLAGSIIVVGGSPSGNRRASRYTNENLDTNPVALASINNKSSKVIQLEEYPDGSFISAVSSETFRPSIAKISSIGTKLWAIDTSTATVRFESFVTDSSGNIYVSGIDTVGSVVKVLLLKINSSGVLQWAKVVNTSGNTSVTRLSGWRSNAIAIDSSENLFVTFQYATDTRVGVLKINSSGTLLWQNTLSITASTTNAPPWVESDGNSAFVSYGNSNVSNLTCFSSTGAVSWSRSLVVNGYSGSAANGITFNSVKGFDLLFGKNITYSTGGTNYTSPAFIKIPSDGTLTGTYGAFTYSSITPTTVTVTHSLSDSSLTFADTSTVGTVFNYNTIKLYQVQDII